MMAMGGLDTAGGTVFDCWTLAPSAMRDWVERAQPGQKLEYARGMLPGRSAAANLSRRLQAQGLVTFVQQRVGGERVYVMQRLRVSPARGPRQRPTRSPKIDGDMARVLRVLRHCTKTNEICPCNRDLARRAKVVNASYQLQKLVDAGIVASRILDRVKGTRLITIIATGRSTGLPEGMLA